MEPKGIYEVTPESCTIRQDVALSEIQRRVSRSIIAAAIADLQKWQQCLTPEQRQQLRELAARTPPAETTPPSRLEY